MKYEHLTVDDQRAMLKARLAQYEREHYAHVVNERILAAAPSQDGSTMEAIAAAKRAQKVLDDAHAAARTQLDGLGSAKTA